MLNTRDSKGHNGGQLLVAGFQTSEGISPPKEFYPANSKQQAPPRVGIVAGALIILSILSSECLTVTLSFSQAPVKAQT